MSLWIRETILNTRQESTTRMPSHRDLAIVINTNLDVGGPCSRGEVCFYGPQNEQMLEELRTCWKGNKDQKKSHQNIRLEKHIFCL